MALHARHGGGYGFGNYRVLAIGREALAILNLPVSCIWVVDTLRQQKALDRFMAVQTH